MNEKIFKIHKNDNVFILLDDVKKGYSFISDKDKTIVINQDLTRGHKIAADDIEINKNIIKYGFPIGNTTKSVIAGEHIHTHNLKTNLKGILDYTYKPNHQNEKKIDSNLSFMGYKRNDSRVGIRNEIWIINTVGCVNKTSEILAQKANKNFKDETDGIFSFPHPFGCSQMGNDQLTTQKILANMVKHPNAGGVLVLGLGCENNNIKEFKKIIGDYDSERVKFLETQESSDEISEGLKLIEQLVKYTKKQKRTKCNISSLIIGLKCGGSDAFSGITANPLLGSLSDKLISYNGTSILTEVPEMFGAETLLMDRCINRKIFDKSVNLINNFKEYYIKNNQAIYDNPSPGNKKGGITTLEEKSLGCVQKGGISNVTDVLDYGDISKEKGLNLLKGPGNDIVAVTDLMAAGAQIILFTTGRGTPLGAPIPTIKISTNTQLSKFKNNWIDFDAGELLTGSTMEEITGELLNYILKVASMDEQTKNEINGYREISIFKNGVTL
ncbi:MAG: altronate dehydratase family protein [Clostridiales bacterium]